MRDKCRVRASCVRRISCSGKVRCGLKCALAAGMSSLAFDLHRVTQVSHIPERVQLAAALLPANSANIPSWNIWLFSVTLFATLLCLPRVFVINIIITIMTLIKQRLIIMVIRGTAGIFVVVIFVLQGAGFTRWMVQFTAKSKTVTLCMRGVAAVS